MKSKGETTRNFPLSNNTRDIQNAVSAALHLMFLCNVAGDLWFGVK